MSSKFLDLVSEVVTILKAIAKTAKPINLAIGTALAIVLLIVVGAIGGAVFLAGAPAHYFWFGLFMFGAGWCVNNFYKNLLDNATVVDRLDKLDERLLTLFGAISDRFKQDKTLEQGDRVFQEHEIVRFFSNPLPQEDAVYLIKVGSDRDCYFQRGQESIAAFCSDPSDATPIESIELALSMAVLCGKLKLNEPVVSVIQVSQEQLTLSGNSLEVLRWWGDA